MTEFTEPSPVLQELLDRLADTVASAADLVSQVIRQAESEGLELQQIRQLVVMALKKRQMGDRTIRRYLPSELKSSNMVRQSKSEIAATMAANLPQQAPSDVDKQIFRQAQAGETASSAFISRSDAPIEREKEYAYAINEIAEKNAQIIRLTADNEGFKQRCKELEGQLAEALVKPASQYVSDLQNFKGTHPDFDERLRPFTVLTEMEARGQLVPVIVKVDPAVHKATVVLDESRTGDAAA